MCGVEGGRGRDGRTPTFDDSRLEHAARSLARSHTHPQAKQMPTSGPGRRGYPSAQLAILITMIKKWFRVFGYIFLVVPSLDFMLGVKSGQKLMVHISPYGTLLNLEKKVSIRLILSCKIPIFNKWYTRYH